MNFALVPVPPGDWPALAELVHRCNRRADGGVRCLHAAQGADVASHAAELAGLRPEEAAFWAITEGDRRVGVVGCEIDAALARAWVRGPLAVEPRVLEAITPLVGPALEAALPAIRCFDAFPSADDAGLNAWYAAAGYAPLELHTVLRATIADATGQPRPVRRATPPDLPALSALHQSLFPSAYIGEADFHRAMDTAADCVLFVADGGDDQPPAGYLFAQDHPHDEEAYVDYLGVVASHRGRGLGRALLDAAAGWGAQRGRGHLALTVREDRRTALELYRRAGFAEISAGRHWRKTLG
jgi:ribosomal-protein-alanine N-acetyltransferase